MNNELEQERNDPLSYQLTPLSSVIYGDDIHETVAFADKLIKDNPELRDPEDVVFMTREERYENAMRKSVASARLFRRIPLDLGDIQKAALIRQTVMGPDASPLDLHYVMFIPALQAHISDEQVERWLPLAMTNAICGTYAQTELGHGTDLRRLETTATYYSAAQEFVLHSPTVTSIKWWPGNLGKFCNSAIVQAQLWINDTCHGPHLFLVQLRDLDTHLPLPGISVGDIGPKFYLNCNDNG